MNSDQIAAVTSINVSWSDPAASAAASDLLEMIHAGGVGRLTTDHASSCYGQPVLVATDGRVLGPGDLPAGSVVQVSVLNPDIDDGGPALLPLSSGQLALAERARKAGYRIEIRD